MESIIISRVKRRIKTRGLERKNFIKLRDQIRNRVKIKIFKDEYRKDSKGKHNKQSKGNHIIIFLRVPP